jgi:hypothetical protein
MPHLRITFFKHFANSLIIKTMKTIKTLVLFFVFLVPFSAFSQDTISTHITSGCLINLRFDGPPEYHFSRTADSITIYGTMEANCGSSHIAIIRRTSDTIIVTTKDTGQMADCYCDFNFKISFKATSKDSLVIFKDSLYNLNIVADRLATTSLDTISNHITTGCISSGFGFPSEYHFSRTADSITMYGKLAANCGSSHIAIIYRTSDTIFVTTLDTGLMATCVCTYNFKITIKASSTDTLVVFNNLLYNLNIVADGLVDMNESRELIDVIYDQAIESMRIRIRVGVQVRMFTIFDTSGRQMLSMSNDRSQVDMSGFESGLYILDFILTDNSHIIKKVIKK